MEPWFNEPLQPQIKVSGDAVTLSFDAAAYDLYMKQWKTKRVILESAPRDVFRRSRSEELTPETAQLAKSYLKQVSDYYRKNGWLDRLVFNSPIDEPTTRTTSRKPQVGVSGARSRARVPFLATKTPVPQHPEWGTLRGFVNNFSIHGNDLNGIAIKDAMREEQARAAR